MVVDYDNYKWSSSQQLCIIMIFLSITCPNDESLGNPLWETCFFREFMSKDGIQRSKFWEQHICGTKALK